MQRYYYALDLKDDAAAIAEYERWHRPGVVWPEIISSIRASGIEEMEIFRTGNRRHGPVLGNQFRVEFLINYVRKLFIAGEMPDHCALRSTAQPADLFGCRVDAVPQ